MQKEICLIIKETIPSIQREQEEIKDSQTKIVTDMEVIKELVKQNSLVKVS